MRYLCKLCKLRSLLQVQVCVSVSAKVLATNILGIKTHLDRHFLARLCTVTEAHLQRRSPISRNCSRHSHIETKSSGVRPPETILQNRSCKPHRNSFSFRPYKSNSCRVPKCIAPANVLGDSLSSEALPSTDEAEARAILARVSGH